MKGSWDRGLDYDTVLRKLKQAYMEAKTAKERGAYAVMLIQLTNGCRVTEAIDALQQFIATRKRETYVKVRKRKDAARLVVIPPIINVDNVQVPSKITVQKRAAKHGFNTHSLRYAFVSKLAREGVAAQVIAKMTGHAKLDYILHYTQQAVAEELLKKTAKQVK